MTLIDPLVFITVHDDGSADFTISVDDEDHRFSVTPDGESGIVEYEETLTYRGEIKVGNPDEQVWRLLMQSDEMTEYLESNSLAGVRRERR